MDNLDLERENQDPKLLSGKWFRNLLKSQRGEIINDPPADPPPQDPPAGDPPAGDPPTLIDPSTIDFSKVDWEKADWKGEFKDDPSMAKHKDPISVIKHNKELEKYVGMDKLPMPAPLKENATAEEIEAHNKLMGPIYQRLGRPESADKYEIKAEYPEEAPLSDEAVGKLKEVAFKEGVSQKGLNSLVVAYGEYLKGEVERANADKIQRAESAVTAIKQKWGNAFEPNTAVAHKAYIGLVNTDNLRKLFGGDKLGNDPEMLEFFYNLGTKLGEGALGGSGIPLTMTPEAAKTKVQELRIQQSKAKVGSPEYKMLQDQINEAYKIANPGLPAPE